MARLIVIVATVGRADLAARTVDLLADQTRPPDSVIVVAVEPADVAGMERTRGSPSIAFAERGSCRQRNHAIDLAAGKADILVFFDDDFLPAPNYLEQVERMFAADDEIVGITGDLVGDGVREGGFSIEDAAERIRARAGTLSRAIRPREALYGCNMAIRVAAAAGLRFDEALPLYGWQEDIDFTSQLGRRGRLVSSGAVTGVHLGASGGRTSGRRLGYSQVANLVYLWRKGTMQPKLGERLLLQNLASNALRSFWPERHIDRRGRLLGNLMALTDLLRGRLDPRRIERM